MNSHWSELPNAYHIDWVIKSVKENPLLWTNACKSRSTVLELSMTYDGWELWDVLDEARDNTWRIMPVNIENFARYFTEFSVGGRATDTAWDSILALIAYNDCDQYINMGYEKLQVYAKLSEQSQAVLLLPMVYVREKLNVRALV